MENRIKEGLIRLFEEWSGVKANEIEKMPPSGSYRQYYRIAGAGIKAIGAYNNDKKENLAFSEFTKHFFSKGLPVPEIYAEDLKNDIYLIRDLGNTTLFSYIEKVRQSDGFPNELEEMYKKVLERLPAFQITAGKDLDYSYCYPREAFDRQSMLWDLHYFKYYFLKLAKIPFYEHELEKDYDSFIEFLLKADCNYFLYRDFQTRNIMLYEGEPYFIDYQGGRRGALQYDVASLLYQAKANIPMDIRHKLTEYYLDSVCKIMPVDRGEFMIHFYGYVLIRMLQAMGAYGFRGFYEKKEHFLTSIPFVANNIAWILDNVDFSFEMPALTGVLRKIVGSDELKKYAPKKDKPNNLIVTINSFSFKRGIPADPSGNGGGFAFDCRALANPGKYEEFKTLTGQDDEVKAFFAKEHDVYAFLSNVYSLVDQSVEKYIDRNFTSLTVNFGCTGGQHRSVYCAEMLAKHLREKYNAGISLNHAEQEILKKERI